VTASPHPVVTLTSPISLHDALPILIVATSSRGRPRPHGHHHYPQPIVRDEMVVDRPIRRPFRHGLSANARSRRGQCLADAGITRSEEHTSELQSRFDVVCRLLLA